MLIIAVRQDAYMIQRYGTVNKAGEKIQRRYVKKALPEGRYPWKYHSGATNGFTDAT